MRTGSKPDSGGGKASSIKQITPSAGLNTALGMEGVTLSGSLKNQTTKKVKAYPRIANGIHRKESAMDAAKKMAANFQPSG